MNMPPKTILLDRRNVAEHLPVLVDKIRRSPLTGFDIETDNRNAHPGILKLESKKVIFDHRRTIITGASFWCDGDEVAYYLNLNHADAENRLPWEYLKACLDAKPKKSWWVIHNAPFELTMLKSVYNYDLTEVICSMQLCVTAYNSDTYPLEKFFTPGIGGIAKLMSAITRAFYDYNAGEPMTAEQEELLMKVVAKESDAEHSYNGYVKSLAYGFDLKQAVSSWFDFKMTTYKETLQEHGAERMGDLTGEQVAAYGADDAYWCLMLYKRIIQWLMTENPLAIQTFFEQENPMVHVYSDTWLNGWRVDRSAIKAKQEEFRQDFGGLISELKGLLKQLLPFPKDLHEKLVEYDTWYAKNAEKYRRQIVDLAETPDVEDPFRQSQQVRSALSNAWAAERGVAETTKVNLLYWMPQRVVFYDLCGFSYQQAEGKTQSDKEAQRIMLERYCHQWADQEGLDRKGVYDTDRAEVKHELLKRDPKVRLLLLYKKMAMVEQNMKLFIVNYLHLTDPETNRMYPTVSCLLDTRRIASQNPNYMQLSARGDSKFIRGFFLADADDHLLVSADFSAIELMLVGEYSKDPTFFTAYGQRPHQDVHSMTAAGMLGLELEEFLARPDAKQLRGDVGKTSGFGYWYSGGLGTTAKKMGWSSEVMWEMVDKFRQTYEVAEQWRLETIKSGQVNGYVELPDHLRRYRFEVTQQWAELMRQKFAPYGVQGFVEMMIRKIQRRSGNMCVNALIQGLCATLIKRKLIRLRKLLAEKYAGQGRVVGSIHDEVLASIHKDRCMEFLGDLYEIMIDGEGLVTTMKIDSSIGIGRNFMGYDKDKNPRGLVELNELDPGLPCVHEGRWKKVATQGERQRVVDYLFS